MLEARRELACRRPTTSKMQRQQYLSTRRMSDGVQHLVERDQLLYGRPRRRRR
jgi:hypothetical protein